MNSEEPAGWTSCRVQEVTTKVGSGATPRGGEVAYRAAGVPFVRSMNVRNEGFSREGLAYLSPEQARELDGVTVADGDILLNITGASIGRSVVADEELVGARVSQHVAIIRFEEGVDPRFAQRFLAAPHMQSKIMQENYGVTRQALTKGMIEGFDLPLAPFQEQRRIVAKIDALSARSKRARADLDRIEGLGARAKRAVLVAAFQGELTKSWREQSSGLQAAAELVAKTPEPDQSRGGREATADVKPGLAALSLNDPGASAPPGWAWVRLRRIARQETGHTPSRTRLSYWDGGVPWIGIRDAGAHHGKIISETIQTVSEEGLANSSARLLPAGTVCLSRTASVGYVTIMGRPMATSQDFATWTCTSAVDPEYLMFALMAEGDQIRNFGEGTTHTTIYFPEIRAFHICLAPKDEQVEIVRRVKLALARIDRMTEDARASSTLLDRLDQSILAKAFRGELVPQDPNDEPASVLLNRIRAKREAASTPQRRGRTARAST